MPVSGKVTLAEGVKLDQFPIRNIVLEPVDPSQGTRRASGSIQADGAFVLSTKAADDGAIPGQYTVTCNITHYPPTDADKQVKWVFDPPTVEVPSGGISDLAIKVSK